MGIDVLCAFAIFLIVSTVTVQANVDVNIEVTPPAEVQQGVTIIIEEQTPTVTISIKDACDVSAALYQHYAPMKSLMNDFGSVLIHLFESIDVFGLGYDSTLVDGLRHACQ